MMRAPMCMINLNDACFYCPSLVFNGIQLPYNSMEVAMSCHFHFKTYVLHSILNNGIILYPGMALGGREGEPGISCVRMHAHNFPRF